MSNDNITPLRPVATDAPAPAEARTYMIAIKQGDNILDFGPFTGFLVTNGYIACILAENGNADTVKFLVNQSDVMFIMETDEVDDED